MRLCFLSILPPIVFSQISLTGAEPCDLPKLLQVYCLEKQLLLIHKTAPTEVKQSLLIQFALHLDRASEQIQTEHKDPVYAIYEDVRKEFALSDFVGDHHYQLRKSFGQTSFGEAVADFIRGFDQDPSQRVRREEARNVLKKRLSRLVKDTKKDQRDVDRFHCTLRSWIDGWQHTGLDPNVFRDNIDVIKEVVTTPELGVPSKVDCKLMHGVAAFIAKVADHCQGQQMSQDRIAMLMTLNQYVDALREAQVPELLRVENQMKERFSYVGRRVGLDQLTMKCEGRPDGRLSEAQLMSVWHGDLNAEKWYPSAPHRSNGSGALFLFPETRLILQYDMSPGSSKAFVVRNVTKNRRGEVIPLLLPNERLEDRVYVTDEDHAFLVDQGSVSLCRVVKRLQGYLENEFDVDPKRDEKHKAILSLWKHSALSKLRDLVNKGVEDPDLMKEIMNEVRKQCDESAKEAFFFRRDAFSSGLRDLIEENLLAKSENLPTQKFLESLRELEKANISQFAFGSKRFINSSYEPDSLTGDEIHLLTVIRMTPRTEP